MTRYEIQKRLHVTQVQKNKVETAVLDCILLAKKRFPRSNIPFPEIRYDLVGNSGGQAIYDLTNPSNHVIRINPILLNENEQEMINQVVPHEMAHVVVNQVYRNERGIPASGHGYEWKSVMRWFGLQPDRCHQMDTTSIKKLKRKSEYVFTCSCYERTYNLSRVKYNNFLGGAKYYCRYCKAFLKFDKVINHG